jgi:hypothetical protein
MALLLSLFLTVFDAAVPTCGTNSRLDPSLKDLARQAEGRVRLCFVGKGMTKSQVARVLGDPTDSIGFVSETASYDHYGVVVQFSDCAVVEGAWALRWAPEFRKARLPRDSGP